MKKLVPLLLLAMVSLFAFDASACAPGQTTIQTSGTVGYQSQTRYISAIGPHPSNFYSLRVSWAINGVRQATETISFGASSGVTILFGQQCEKLYWSGTPITDPACDTPDGWHSTGNADRAFDVNPMHFGSTPSEYTTLLYINGLKIAEVKGGLILSNGDWHFAGTGLTKIQAGTEGRFSFYGYDGGGALVSHTSRWLNACD